MTTNCCSNKTNFIFVTNPGIFFQGWLWSTLKRGIHHQSQNEHLIPMKSWGSTIAVALLGIGAGCHTSDAVNLQCETKKTRRKREGLWHSIVSSWLYSPFPQSFMSCLHAEVTSAFLKLIHLSQQLACVQACFKLITDTIWSGINQS